MSQKVFLVCCLLSWSAGAQNTISAAAAPFPAVERTRMLAAYREQTVVLDDALGKAPREVPLYSRRGDCHLFLGNFASAIADFERMIALDPAQDAPHWRLGIAYYFAGQFAKSARQFEKYHAYDGRDRENGIWKFLADVNTIGLERARRAMLAYTRFDREPFPALYDLLAGTTTTTSFFTGITERKLTGEPAVIFFAHYYGGLNEIILGNREEGLRLLREAVANPWGRTGERGPVYMWQVARLHYEQLTATKP